MKKYFSRNKPLVALIVLNWNGKDVIENCLNSLLKTEYDNYKVIVVDNGSTDGSVKIIKKKFKRKVELIENKENVGFPKGMNIGIRHTLKKYSPQYVGLLNNDLLFPDKFWLKKIIEFMERDETIGVALPLFIFLDGRLQRVGEKLGKNLASIMIKILTALPEKNYKGKLEDIKEVDVFLGAAPIIRKETLQRAGLLDERYSPFLVEDVEYSFRVKKLGYKCITVCTSKVIHLLSHSTRKLGKESVEKDLFKVYVATRNAFLFSIEYFGVYKSLFISLPIIIFATFFERKNKDKGLNLANLKLRSNPFKRVIKMVKAIKDAFSLSYFKF